MLTIDIVIVSLMAIFFILGFRKGLIISLFSFLAFFLAIIGSMALTRLAIDELNIASSNQTIPYIAYFLVFLVIFILVFFAGKLIEKIVKLAQINLINRFAGGILGSFKVIFLISLLFWLSSQVTFIKTNKLKESYFYNVFSPVAPKVIEFVTNNLSVAKGLIDKIESDFNKDSKLNSENTEV